MHDPDILDGVIYAIQTASLFTFCLEGWDYDQIDRNLTLWEDLWPLFPSLRNLIRANIAKE